MSQCDIALLERFSQRDSVTVTAGARGGLQLPDTGLIAGFIVVVVVVVIIMMRKSTLGSQPNRHVAVCCATGGHHVRLGAGGWGGGVVAAPSLPSFRLYMPPHTIAQSPHPPLCQLCTPPPPQFPSTLGGLFTSMPILPGTRQQGAALPLHTEILDLLTLLDQNGCSYVIDRGNLILDHHSCPNLLSLTLSGCGHIEDQDVVLVLQSCARLRSLRLENCVRITDCTLHAMATHGRSLTDVQVDFCRNVTREGLQAVREVRPEIQLTAERSAGMIPDSKPQEKPQLRRTLQKLLLFS
ncbi:hypothetical protein JZ751_016571 [Albula glossodonta]|uniref:F-box/LRR-repeat protein 15-like leucin rich repeat domain-containing protein n=1 Tax=Albula glossodonta TaxID=121402 RepID=A0A8T2MVA4_9TELE|nr:hypothetical protein JZ751_016571 [Albula glossodonta]